MYLSSLTIHNFRCFQDTKVEFTAGLNLLIGENNSGKTAVIEALRLLFERTGRTRPTFEDFHRPFAAGTTEPPKISITATFRSNPDDSVAEKALVATWLTKVDEPWEAAITYDFFLPEIDAAKFRSRLAARQNELDFFEALVDLYVPKYVTRFWAGDPTNQNRAEPDLLAKFSLNVLGALRDAEGELSSGRNALMRRILSQILDQDLEDGAGEKDTRTEEFQSLSRDAIAQLKGRLDTKTLFGLIESVGAKDGGDPDFQGKVSEAEMLAALRLFIQQTGFSHPLELNGLGYNNLIYISLILASIQHQSSQAVGENAVAYAMLSIEEPEAHLHPVLQARLLRFIRAQLKQYKAKQVFLTSHSTHITSQCSLDSLVCLNRDAGFKCFYPGKALIKEPESKVYLERYLDATKSNLLFLKGVIIVEGPTELILVSRFADSLGLRLEDYRVGVIVADGVASKHFANLFDLGTKNQGGLGIRLSCVVDADPLKAEMTITKKKKEKKVWKKCYPYEVKSDEELFKPKAGHLVNLEESVKDSAFVKVFHGEKTFEYDFALTNFSETIITDTLSTPAQKELKSYLKSPSLDSLEQERAEAIEGLKCSEARKLAGWATLFTEASGSKADQAEAIALKLEEKDHGIKVPDYIERAIKWACQI